MALAPGTRLGVYEIVAQIGEGGMGLVYRARDTKLNRDVALKVLPDLFASDADRLARFTREAQTLASLNHPNIAHIHGLEESGGVRALRLRSAISSREHFRDDIGRAVFLPDVKHGEDVRVVERGSGLRLEAEATQTVGIRREGRGQNLHSDITMEQYVAGSIDLAHSTSSDKGENLEALSEISGGAAWRHREYLRILSLLPPLEALVFDGFVPDSSGRGVIPLIHWAAARVATEA